MGSAALLFAIATSAPHPALPPAWRLVDLPDLHIGARPFALVTNDGPEWAVGATIQISTLRMP